MNDLIEQLQSADGPNRGFDAALAKHWGHTVCSDQGRWRVYGGAVSRTNKRKLPAYTSDLNAALTLLPDGWEWTAGVFRGEDDNGPPFFADCGNFEEPNGNEDCTYFEARGQTPAIAICIAALKAKGN